MSEGFRPTEESGARQTRGHTRRPPLAEIDSWELWQAWKRGERAMVMPWLGLLASFCVVLAGMYSFFFFSTTASGDPFGQVLLTIAFLILFFVLWRRISPRRSFALGVVSLLAAASCVAFLIWLAAYILSGWNPWIALGGTLLLGLTGVLLGLPSLDAIAQRQKEEA